MKKRFQYNSKKYIKLLEVINQTTPTINHQNQPPRSSRHRCPHPNPQAKILTAELLLLPPVTLVMVDADPGVHNFLLLENHLIELCVPQIGVELEDQNILQRGRIHASTSWCHYVLRS